MRMTNIELARWRVEMIRLIAFALVAATTPASAQNQPYNPNAPQHYNNAPGLYAPGLTGGPRTYPGPGGYPYWSGYVDAPVGHRSPLLLDYPAPLGRSCVARSPRAHLRLIGPR